MSHHRSQNQITKNDAGSQHHSARMFYGDRGEIGDSEDESSKQHNGEKIQAYDHDQWNRPRQISECDCAAEGTAACAGQAMNKMSEQQIH